jgi:hypothetical protein
VIRDGPSDRPAAGDGVVAMAVAALNRSGRGTESFAASGDWLLIAWGWALARGDRLRPVRGRRPAGPRGAAGPDVEGFGETVEEQPTTADGRAEVRGRTVRER